MTVYRAACAPGEGDNTVFGQLQQAERGKRATAGEGGDAGCFVIIARITRTYFSKHIGDELVKRNGSCAACAAAAASAAGWSKRLLSSRLSHTCAQHVRQQHTYVSIIGSGPVLIVKRCDRGASVSVVSGAACAPRVCAFSAA